MAGITSLLKTFTSPSSLIQAAMMGPGGLVSLAAKSLFSAIGQQVIQKLGEKLGLPQSIIDGAQAAFCATIGDKAGVKQNVREAAAGIARDFNLSPVQQGQLERAANDDVRNMVDQIATSMTQSKDKPTKSGGGSWLMAIAESLGRTSDKLAGEMKTMSDNMGTGDEKSKSSDNLKFGAKSQEFNMFFSSANTVLKTLGEALASGARKQ